MATTKTPKPLIALQIDDFRDACRRCIIGEIKGVICIGPPGIGKDVSVIETARLVRHTYKPIQNATMAGIVSELASNPSATFWLNDFDEWMTNQQIVNFFKILMDSMNPRIVKIDHNTLREGVQDIPFPGRMILTSNVRMQTMPARMKMHLEALSDRFYPVTISTDPAERLKYIDWMVTDRYYFRSKLFWKTTQTKPLSLMEIQDVLDFLHKYADRIPLTLRALNRLANERKRDPEGWTERCKRAFTDDVIPFVAPPAPIVRGYREQVNATMR